MKAISIRQPWAWLIMHAGKDIENRDWWTTFRGRVWVHAAKQCTIDEYWAAMRSVMVDIDESIEIPALGDLERGAIVGSVEIIDVVVRSASPWFFGDYGFVLRAPRPLTEPVSCRGALGFWDVPADTAALLTSRATLPSAPPSQPPTDNRGPQ